MVGGEGVVRVVVYWFCGEVKRRGSGMMENVFSITSVTFGIKTRETLYNEYSSNRVIDCYGSEIQAKGQCR